MNEGASSVYVVYLCAHCTNWHARWLGLLDPDYRMAEAVRIIATAQVASGLYTTPGLVVVGGVFGDGHIASLFQDGALARGTYARTAIPAQLEALLDRDMVGKALELLAEQGESRAYVHDDWPAILGDLLDGQPQQQIMSSDELAKLWDR